MEPSSAAGSSGDGGDLLSPAGGLRRSNPSESAGVGGCRTEDKPPAGKQDLKKVAQLGSADGAEGLRGLGGEENARELSSSMSLSPVLTRPVALLHNHKSTHASALALASSENGFALPNPRMSGANDVGKAERESLRAGEERGDGVAGGSQGREEGGGNGDAEAEEEVLHNPVLALFPSGSATDATSGEAGGGGEGVGSGRREEGSRAARTPLDHELLCPRGGGGGGMDVKAPQSL